MCDKKNKNCKDFFENYSTLRIGLISFGIYIDNDNYSNPIQRYFREFFFDLSKSSFINTNIIMSNDFVLTDVGIMFEEFKKEIFVNFDKSQDHLIIKDKQEDLRMLQIQISYSSIVNYSQRKYVKLQETISRVGGFFNSLMILSTILIHHYNKFCFNLHTYSLIEKIYDNNDSLEFNHLIGEYLQNNDKNSQKSNKAN